LYRGFHTVMAEAQLDKTVRGPREQAHRFCRRVEVLATAAALLGEDIDMKAMRSFVKGYNCSITEPKLWGALERSDCTFSRLVSIAEKCEVRYKLKRDDPVADRQPKMHMSPDNDRSQKTRAIFPEDRSDNGNGSWTKSALCHKCGMTGHIRPTCEWEGEDKHLERMLPPRKKGAPFKKKAPMAAGTPAGPSGSAPWEENPAPAPKNSGPVGVTPAPPVPTRKVMIRPKVTPCKTPAEMELADFRAAMEHLFDAAGFGLNTSNDNAFPAGVAQESAGTQRTVINISAAGENKGWLALVDIDDVLMMLAVDTGAGMKIVNKSKMLTYMDALDLEPSPYEFRTANGELLERVGQFYATLRLGPVVLENFCVTVADVVGDGLLGRVLARITNTGSPQF
jgi:hypothetical protein